MTDQTEPEILKHTDFSKLGLDPSVVEAVKTAGYSQPTEIQEHAIPPALAGKDVLGIAQTGTGKTASFVLPMISTLNKGRAKARMPRSLVVAPTRELASQVAQNFETYAANSNLKMSLLIGGVSFAEQLAKIDRGVDVLIATPGRLLDHFERGRLLLSGVGILVIDEADRMLDMGFIPDIERIFSLIPPPRQTLFFSATMPSEIERVINQNLSNPVRVEVTRRATVSADIIQLFLTIKPTRRDQAFKEKRALLRRKLADFDNEISNAIIFCNRKSDVEILRKSMRAHRIGCSALHGDLDQSVRTRVLDDFRKGDIRFLIASDVAARGLDVSNVSHVINFDVPPHSEDYVHRIGRTGRAGRTGKAITICLPADERHMEAIEKLIGHKIDREADEGETKTGSGQKNRQRTANSGQQKDVAASQKEPRKPRGAKARSSREKGSMQRGSPPQPPVEDNVVGMGDHIPEFMTKQISTRSPSLTNS